MGALSAAPGLLGGASPAVGGLLNTAKNTMGMVSQAQAMIANPMSALPAAGRRHGDEGRRIDQEPHGGNARRDRHAGLRRARGRIENDQ
ncbi:hypothetical protein G6F22_020680 [Rhizopus arrhizus]|nr:hypothetical protein G6F22_020680 [Rhizopus arrhizus]